MGISRESRTAQIFGVPHIISGTGIKLRTLNFVHTFIRSITTKAHEKKLGKVAVDIVKESRKFLGHPYMGHSILVIYVLHLHLHYTVKLLIEAPSVSGFY